MDIILYFLLGLVLLILVSGAYMFVVACVRTKDRPWLEPEKLKGSSYEKYIDLIQSSHKWLQEHNAQDIYVTSEDGLKLHGLWVKAENPKGTILLAHGYRSTMLVDFGKVMPLYHELGLNLLLPQQRAHGESEGKYITFGVKESRDMLCWLQCHNSRLCDCPVILSGLSMGASTVLFMADENLPSNVKGIIADCGFNSPRDILAKVYRNIIKLPPEPTIWAAELFARLFAGFSLYAKDSRKTLAKNKLPIIMVHGTGDDFVPCEMTKVAYEVCTGDKQILLAEGAGHGLSFLKEPVKYKTMVIQFLEKNLEGF